MLDHSRGPRPLNHLKVVVRPLSDLKPNPRNARTHSRRQIRQVADSIEAFGFNNPGATSNWRNQTPVNIELEQ